jgi:hypothetical protein
MNINITDTPRLQMSHISAMAVRMGNRTYEGVMAEGNRKVLLVSPIQI